MTVTIPDLSLVVLVGVSGSGKSTFAAKHFLPTETVSSDVCRGLVADDPTDQSATEAAFAVLHEIVGQRLRRGLLTVVDATNVQPDARKSLVRLARDHHVPAVALVLDVPDAICAQRNAERLDRQFGPHVLRNQRSSLRRSMPHLGKEGFQRVVTLRGVDDVEQAALERVPLWVDKRSDDGPFDVIGDVHGCHAELVDLLRVLGYEVADDGLAARHPGGRRAVFVGDLVDRGPAVPDVLRLAMRMVADGTAHCISGNHEAKLLRALDGRHVSTGHGLAESLAQLADEPPEFTAEVTSFLRPLVTHLVFDDGRLVVAQAGLPEAMHRRASAVVRSFALYGDTTGETDEYGLPVRYPWADDYRGKAAVVYGHTPVPDAVWVNNTICLDTGCVFGGSLTALRWPERELVSVPARAVHYQPARPIGKPAAVDEAEARAPLDLDLTDVTGRRRVTTTLSGNVTINEENAAAALEVMSRFAVDPRWLVYLPPTMSPAPTSNREGYLEHPDEAFDDLARTGLRHVVVQDKHMGSRAVVVLGRDDEATRRAFSISNDAGGVVLTRTGRAFFRDDATQRVVVDEVRHAADRAGLWDELETDWLVLDAELLPWSAKAGDLLRTQYAPVGLAGTTASAAEVEVWGRIAARGIDVGGGAARAAARLDAAAAFTRAWTHYCWPADDPAQLRLAPFAVLAGRGRVHARRPHAWQLDVLGRLADHSSLVTRTTSTAVDLADPDQRAAAVAWWEATTGAGAEGMVVKPADSIVTVDGRLAQPGVKVRGRDYLRIIYGPDYTDPANLTRLRKRGLGHKRSLALREFALGIEALDRFVAGEPLWRVHECVFGVLALESEPVDARL